MKNSRLLRYLTLIFIIFVLAGCKSASSPEDVYWQYWEKCSNGQFDQAEQYLSGSARERSQVLGVCGFTHDAINTLEVTEGQPERTFSEDPERHQEGDNASLTWYDDQGNIATVVLVKTEGEWKVTEAIWSK